MWQVDNDRYALWRLEHELGAKRLDRLLNSVTVGDRTESPRLARWKVMPPVGLFQSFFRLIYSLAVETPIVRRAPE